MFPKDPSDLCDPVGHCVPRVHAWAMPPPHAREAHEELGIPLSAMTVLGATHDVVAVTGAPRAPLVLLWKWFCFCVHRV